MGILCNCLVGALPPHKNDLTRPPAMATAKKQKRYPGCLGHAVIGVFYSVVANRHQPNVYIMLVYGEHVGEKGGPIGLSAQKTAQH